MRIRTYRAARRCGIAAAIIAAALALPHAANAGGQKLQPQLQRLIDTYLTGRAAIEGISGIALRVDRGPGQTPIALFAGNDGLPGKRALTGRTLFQIGSNTKLFTAVLILQLEAAGKLSIGDPIGKYLPQYPAWKSVTIRSLLDMTSELPNYSETISIGQAAAADIHHQFSDKDLVAAVYPGTNLPHPPQWFYSNTNNILAALIIERVTGLSYHDALDSYIVKKLGLTDTSYPIADTPADVVARLPRGLYENAACQLYQPQPCSKPVLAPLVGRDMRTQNLSWAGAAGAMISTPRDLETWIRALFSGRVLPAKQFAEMTTLVSSQTGQPIAEVDKQNPRGFGLDVAKIYDARLGVPFWFYQGETMGYRVVFIYYPKHDLLITGATNSQPPEGQDDFGKTVLGGAAEIVLTTKQ